MSELIWTQYFMNLVYVVAMRSKDESTHIGSIIVDEDNCIVATGYNSFPFGIDDNDPTRQLRPEKYFFFSHAEANSIAISARNGHPTKGCRMYTNGIPCADCARLIIGAGIIQVIYDVDWQDKCSEEWIESSQRSMDMFNESGVMLSHTRVFLQKPIKFIRGREI